MATAAPTRARGSAASGRNPGPTNLSLTTTGAISLTAGSSSGAAIGANSLGGESTAITINSGGDVTLTPGSGAGAYIGSPSSNVAGGNISITSGGNIMLAGTGSVATGIYTTGNVILVASAAGGSIFGDTASVIDGSSLTTTSDAGTVLDGANTVASFNATNNSSGNISLVNMVPLDITGITNSGGDVTVNNTGSINISGTSNSDGKLTIAALGSSSNLTLGSGAALSDSAAGDALVLAAAGNFINNAGASALFAPSGRWLVYSTNPAFDIGGGLAYNFKQYGLSYSGAAYTGPGIGNGFIYSVTPSVTVSLTGTASKTYDGTSTAFLAPSNYATTGAIDGDTIILSDPVIGMYANKNAGTGKSVSTTVALLGASNGGASVYGYQILNTSVSGNIGQIIQAPLTIGATSNTKTYDGTTSATATPTVTGTVFAGDTLTGLGEVYSDKNAGTGKTLTVAPGYALTDGNGGNNYAVTAIANTTGVVTPATLTYLANLASMFQGATVPTLSGSVIGFVAGETLTSATSGSAAWTTPATSASLAGQYAINGGGLKANFGNYVFVQAHGNATALTINTRIGPCATTRQGKCSDDDERDDDNDKDKNRNDREQNDKSGQWNSQGNSRDSGQGNQNDGMGGD